MKYLKYIFLSLSFLFWPVSLYFKNTIDFTGYFIPGVLVLTSLLLYSKPSPKTKILSLVFFILAMTPVFFSFSKNSIFIFDPLAYDLQVKKVAQIPSRLLSRVVQNKYTIYLDKYTSNIFLGLDTNNYFFSLHPRETGNNQNLNKFSYLALPIFLMGLYIVVSTRQKYPLILLLTTIFLLSFQSNFDKYDFLLWPTICVFIFKGAIFFEKKYPRLSFAYYLFSIPLVIFDLFRIFLLRGA